MARKLSSKVKKSFGIFSGVVLAGMGGMGGAVVRAAGTVSDQYAMEIGSLVYDNAYSRINLEGNGEVQRELNGNWNLKVDGGEKYDLGKKTVAYEPQSGSLKVFGGGWQFKEDGTVVKLSNFEEIPLTESGFIKLSDRKYVLVGDDIHDASGKVTADGFLYIIADKAGNAHMMNDVMNVTSMDEMILNEGDFQYNIAEETLALGENVVDLQSVMSALNVVEDPFNLGRKKYAYTVEETAVQVVKAEPEESVAVAVPVVSAELAARVVSADTEVQAEAAEAAEAVETAETAEAAETAEPVEQAEPEETAVPSTEAVRVRTSPDEWACISRASIKVPTSWLYTSASTIHSAITVRSKSA